VKIAYGTYALPESPLAAAIPMLADLGYDGVEICISRQQVGSVPDELNPARRQKIKGLLQWYGLGRPHYPGGQPGGMGQARLRPARHRAPVVTGAGWCAFATAGVART
jgi:sugar phosphate isomerase/epimerase